MVDVERLASLLEVIRDEIASLRRLAALPELDDDQVAAVKYRFIVAIEAAIDVGQHVIASEELGTAGTFADVFVRLADADWIPEELGAAISDAARFRNLLVHGYADVDDERVLETLGVGPDDLEAFVRALAERLAAG